MRLKFFVFCPDDEKVINAVIEAASSAGAGKIGKYSHCAFIIKGQGNWKSEPGSTPTIGEVGKTTRSNEVKIEMECPNEVAPAVVKAIQKVHPYEEAVIDFVQLYEHV